MRMHVLNSQPASRPQPSLGIRVLMHASLLGACATLVGAAVVWPQWVAADGARAALTLQKERENDLSEKWEQTRMLNDRLYGWRSAQRRIFLDKELGSYPATVAAVAKQCGVAAQATWVNQSSSRWRSASLTGGAWSADAADLGEIRPRTVKVTVSGSFDGVYRMVATLCTQQQLFVPERWNVVPASEPGAKPGSTVRAEVVGVVFVLQQGDALPKPAKAVAPLAFRPEGGGING